MRYKGVFIDTHNVHGENCSQQIFHQVCDGAHPSVALIKEYAGTLNDTAVSQFELILFQETNEICSLSENKFYLFALSE